MISIKNLTKKYGKTLANDNLSMEFESGKLTILLGPNGSGKTTLIKSICGLHCPNNGTIMINNLDHEDLAAKQMLAYTPEKPVLYDYLTLDEHLKFILKGYDKENLIGTYDQLLEDFQMKDLKKKIVKDFSNGQKQKVSILMALVIDTPILVLDEPFNGLDPESVEFFKKTLRNLVNQGKTILLSTHLLDLAKTIADGYKILRKGVIVTECGIDDDILNTYLDSGK